MDKVKTCRRCGNTYRRSPSLDYGFCANNCKQAWSETLENLATHLIQAYENLVNLPADREVTELRARLREVEKTSDQLRVEYDEARLENRDLRALKRWAEWNLPNGVYERILNGELA